MFSKLFQVIHFLIQSAFLLISNIVLDLLGLVIVAIALLFVRPAVSKSDGRNIVNLPKWAWLWGNDYDGVEGDKRNWWADNCDKESTLGLFPWLRTKGINVPVIKVNSYWARYWWTAIRNPANNMRFTKLWSAPITGSKITYYGKYDVADKPGRSGWQFVIAENNNKRYYGFYLVHEWTKTHAFVIRFGFKITPDMNNTVSEPKGMVTKINLYKVIKSS